MHKEGKAKERDSSSAIKIPPSDFSKEKTRGKAAAAAQAKQTDTLRGKQSQATEK